MQTADLTVKESELNIVYGPYTGYIKDKVPETSLASVRYLFSDLTDIRRFYMRLGFHLDEFYRMCGYLDFGFITLYDFCEANLGLDRGAVSRCINVYKQFNASGDISYGAGCKTAGCAMELSERWKDYSYTQLCEMLPLTDRQREKVTPDMTVRQIREYKRKLRNEERRSMEPDKGLKLIDELVVSTQPGETQAGSAASARIFDFEEYAAKKGFLRNNYIRKCEPAGGGRLRYLYIFDDRGREIAAEYSCDILFDDGHDIVLRLYNHSRPLEWDE